MFEQELHTEGQRLLRLLSSPEPYISVQALQQLPEAEAPYRQYLLAELRWHLYQEQLLRLRHPYFDYTAPELQHLLHRLDSLLLQHARFPRQELEAIVESAVKVRLNFLCRPRTTLKWFIFRGEPVKSREEILYRLQYFADYPYLLAGLRNQLHPLELDSTSPGLLSIVEFERMVQQADDAVLEYTPTQFLALLQPLANFFQRTHPIAPPNHLPTAALVIFLDDKGIRYLAQELEGLLRRQRLLWISYEQFLELVFRLLEELEAPSPDRYTLPLEFPTQPHEQPLSSDIPVLETAEVPSSEGLPTRSSEDFPTPSSTNIERSTNAEANVTAALRAIPPDDTTHPDPILCPEPIEPQRAEVSPEPPLPIPAEPSQALVSPQETAESPAIPDGIGHSVVPAEWFLEPTPTGDVIWSDGSVADDILQATWSRSFADFPELEEVPPTPLPPPQEAPSEQPSNSDHEPPLQTAPAPLVQYIRSPEWRRRYQPLLPQESAWESFTQALLRCPHWKAAAAAIDQFFAIHRISPTSRLAEQFRQEILRFYQTQTSGNAVR
ncbi:MAG: hypothetical protein NZ960_08045 [Candidatus Kapabacteria bacterium]|nr:hypothetical protein [Candidatus Kapabacteria bacterium]MDW8012868.1 hypothetical protein [Bacteroidota bacterium]